MYFPTSFIILFLKNVTSVRGIGNTLYSKFIGKAYIIEMMGFIHILCIPFKDPHSVLTLYSALVRKKTGIWESICNPHYNKYGNSGIYTIKCGLLDYLRSYDVHLEYLNINTLGDCLI